jgi:hypothetical protein
LVKIKRVQGFKKAHFAKKIFGYRICILLWIIRRELSTEGDVRRKRKRMG